MDSSWSNFCLIIYFLAWLIVIIRYQKKKRYFDAGSFLLVSYAVFAFLSWRLFNNPDFGYSNRPIHLFPFIYLFLMLLMASSTVLRYDTTRIDRIQNPPKVFIIVVAVFFVFTSLAHFPSSISHFGEGIMKLMLDDSVGQSLYQESLENRTNDGDGSISNLSAIFSSAFYNIGVLYTFYYLTLPRRKKWFEIALLLSCLMGIVAYISLGQRGGVFIRTMTIIITYLSFRKFYPKKLNKKVGLIGLFLLFLISIPIIAITLSRFGEKEGGASGSIMMYMGQENINFNNYALDDGGIRYGDRTVPLFKRMLGFQNVPDNFWQRREKYPHLKMDDDVFYTFVGDFTIDYGPIVAVILFVVFTIIFNNLTRVRGRTVLFHQLILIHFVMCVCAQGAMELFTFSDVAGNLQLIVAFLSYLLCFYDYKSKKRIVLVNNKIDIYGVESGVSRIS